MSFNTFCGQDSTNPATYQRVLLRFQEGGGGGGVATVNNGTNINIGGLPANPTVNLNAPLTSTLNMGAQPLTDSAGAVGLLGEVLTCGAGGLTLWGALPAGAPVITSTNVNALLFPTLVTAGGGVPRPLFCDDLVTPISVNPSNGNFNVVDTVIITQSQLAIGKTSGAVAQSAGGVAIGFAAANNNQGQDAISIGSNAGNTTQGQGAVAIGAGAANNNQGIGGIAIGQAASTGAFQGAAAIAIGVSSCGDPLTSQGNGAVAIGSQAGFTQQGAAAVAIGEDAGYGTQSGGAVAIGDAAGNITQGQDAVAIGTSAGLTNQGADSVAIGINAGLTNQSASCVGIGLNAGRTTQALAAVAIGEDAGQITQGQGAVAIAVAAGTNNQGAGGVAIGNSSGNVNQGASAVAIGGSAGNTTQGTNSVAIGTVAGEQNQSAGGVAVGFAAGNLTQGADAVAIGTNAGLTTQSANAIAIGENAGTTTQGNVSVAIGFNAGQTNQGASSIAMGDSAGQTNQGASCIAIGASSGQTTQGNGGNSCIAVGIAAGQTTQGNAAIAFGYQAGQNNQGASSIAIGLDAATLNQSANSICLNASGAALQAPNASLYVAPIINSGAIANPVPAATNFLLYNTATAEVTYGDGAGIGGGGGASVNVINCVPWGYELTTNGSLLPIKSATSAEFMLGNFSTTVSNLYDITGVAPNTVPPFYGDAVFCTCFVNLVIPETVFTPPLPYSAGGFGNILNQDITSGVVPPYSLESPTQILWRLGYTISTGGGPPSAFTDLATPTFASSPVLNFPELALVFSPPIGNKFHSSVSMTGLLDVTGMLPADIISFELQAYCNVSGSQIDTTTATGGTTGSINLMCRPVRNP